MKYNRINIDGRGIFYRETGHADAPALLLLHGFPTSSHMFRDLMPRLADRYHVVAPDLPGFGFSDAPARAEFKYTFDNLARVIEAFAGKIGLRRYALYVFDYGAPVGFRLALAHPERVTAIISQNGNAYEEGLSQGWNPVQRYWREPTPGNRAALRDFLKPETTKWQYTHGVADESLVAPESYTLDAACLPGPTMTRFNSTCSLIMQAMWRFIRSSRRISAHDILRCWRFGGKTIPSSSRRERKPTSAITLTRRWSSSILATSRSKPT